MSILIVIANYYPVHNPNVFRWQAIAEHWVTQGRSVHVLTTTTPNTSNEEEINGVKVYRTAYATLKDLYHGKTGTENTRNIPDAGTETAKPNSKWLERVVDMAWRNWYWPDGSMPFLKPGFKRGDELVKSLNIERVYSVGLPFTCHLIARKLKKKNEHLKWHMDIEDPFCYSKELWVNNFKLYKHKNIREEELAFQMADSISVTNENAKLEYRAYFAEELHKLSIIPPLHVPAMTEVKMVLDSTKTHFAYFGSFYENVRSPELFLEFLSYLKSDHFDWLEDKRFHFYGQENLFSKNIFDKYPELEKFVIREGLIERSQSINQMKEVDVLINFGNVTSYHLPSKCVDYLASKKPILNIKQNNNDSFEKFVKGQKAVVSLALSKTDFLLAFEKVKALIENKAINEFDLKLFKVDAIAVQYIQSLENKEV